MENKNRNDHKYKIQDLDVQACSATDCTGLIPAAPANQEELENYEEVYPYLAKTTCPTCSSTRDASLQQFPTEAEN